MLSIQFKLYSEYCSLPIIIILTPSISSDNKSLYKSLSFPTRVEQSDQY